MLLNYYIATSAIVIGVISGRCSIKWLRAGLRSGPTVARTCLAAASMSLLISGGALLISGLDIFALIHAVYVIATLGIPIAAITILLLSRERPRAITAICLLSLLGIPIGVYATHIEPFWLRVDVVEFVIKDLDEQIRIGVLSDLQSTEVGNYENRAVDRLLNAAPDIVVIPGDLYQFESELFDERAPEFRRLIQRIADDVPFVYLVSGNTDTVSGLLRIARGSGAQVLDNQTDMLELKGTTLRIAGTTLFGDEMAARRMIKRLSDDERADVRLLLAHKPDAIELLPRNGADLVIAGHTHGGQVSLPLLGPPLTLSSVPRHVAAGGLHELNGIAIYVSTGVGRERGHAPQMRIGVRPSIGIIDLVSSDAMTQY